MSSLKFGTSGLRGLVVDLVGAPARTWTSAFLCHARSLPVEQVLLVGRDLRHSSPRVAADCLAAATAAGWRAIDCGALPTPGLALEALARSAAAIMVTGSHIPDDRNGLKFYAPGEITKADEAAIQASFDAGVRIATVVPDELHETAPEVINAYRHRYTTTFAPDSLLGLTIGVYQQSSVARDVLVEILTALGAVAVPLGWSEDFLPVDTEAHRPEDMALIAGWAAEGRFDAIVSTDGDADRPLVADATGQVVRGDLLGLLTAHYLRLSTIVTPVTSSSMIDTSGVGKRVIRTRVGSPFVIEGMNQAIADGAEDVLGFEANGGVLLGSPVQLPFGVLAPLPTRDAVLPILCALALMVKEGFSLRACVDELGVGYAVADRIKDVPASVSAPFLKRLSDDSGFDADFLGGIGTIGSKDNLDGIRFLLTDGSVLHFRASGNAPELRVYAEAPSPERADHLLRWSLTAVVAEITG